MVIIIYVAIYVPQLKHKTITIVDHIEILKQELRVSFIVNKQVNGEFKLNEVTLV